MGLGKGISALISKDTLKELNESYLPAVPIDQIVANPYQPRVEIKPETLIGLSDSIREHGIVEPLIVTRTKQTEFQLIAGERRWRAAKMAQIKTIPVVIKETSPQQMLEIAVVENIQRKDLNPLEEAMAFEQLEKLFGMTHGDIADKVGLSRPALVNKMRLLGLPKELKRNLLEGKLSEGHARALLGLTSKEAMLATAKIVIRDGLSVRAVEELVRRLNQGHKKPRNSRTPIHDEYTQTLETNLQNRFGKKVKLVRSQRGGKIVIPFENDQELEKIYKTIT